jgi:glucose-1-phosphate thymidylyltransferase
MKGIVLAGGTGSRLWPITKGISKQLLPVYDKPLIHYPIATLFLAGIREILIITSPDDSDTFMKLLGDGSNYGVTFQFGTQKKPNGIAEAFLIGASFIGNEEVALVLGDNIFHGSGLGRQLQKIKVDAGATVFAHKVEDPSNYGVIEFDSDSKVVSLEEKPRNPKSDFVIPGLYFYDSRVVEFAERIVPSDRGELEITSINQIYFELDQLNVKILERGTTWFDTGTAKSLNDASNFIRVVEETSQLKVACLEEIAFNSKWIDAAELKKSISNYRNSDYGKYLQKVLDQKTRKLNVTFEDLIE